MFKISHRHTKVSDGHILCFKVIKPNNTSNNATPSQIMLHNECGPAKWNIKKHVAHFYINNQKILFPEFTSMFPDVKFTKEQSEFLVFAKLCEAFFINNISSRAL